MIRSQFWRIVAFIAFLAASFCSYLLTAASGSPSQNIKVDVNLVNVFVTVQDENGEFLNDLKRDDFRLYEDDVPQNIVIFQKQENVRSAIGFLMDSSGSMVDILPLMRTAVRDFTRGGFRLDDYFVVTFGTNVRLIHTGREGQRHLEEAMNRMKAYGTSLMYDALLYGMETADRVEPERKALIVFTDGNDNGSATGHDAVVKKAQKSGVLLYFIAIGSRVLLDTNTLDDLAGASGGRTLYVAKQDALSPVLEEVRSELSKQYYLGYYAPRTSGFHRIRIEVPGKTVTIHAKKGYLS